MKNETLAILRARAEKAVEEKGGLSGRTTNIALEEIFHELQIYQVELEMQNDELLATAADLQKQKQKFYDLFEGAPVGYIVISKEGIIRDINKTGLRFFNRDKRMMVEKPLTAFIASPDTIHFYNFLRKIAKNNIEQSCEVSFTAKDLDNFYALLNAVAVGDDELNQEIYLTITDITEKQLAQDALNKAKQRLDLSLEASATGICELDPDTGYFYFDKYSSLIFGFDTGIFEGSLQQLAPKMHPDDREMVEKQLRSSIIRERPLSIEFRVLGEDQGITYIHARGRLTYNGENKRRFLATFTDVTEKRLLEQETLRLKEQQEKALLEATFKAEENQKQKLSEALHDGVGQMLYAATLSIDQLRSQAKDDSFDVLRGLIEQTIKDVRNLSFELTPAILLDFGLGAAIDEMIARLSTGRLSFITTLDLRHKLPDSAELNIYRIVQELVNNCVKHSGCDRITIEVRQKGNSVAVQVIDNGKGIDCSTQGRKRSGTGLSSIRNRIRLYDGQLNIKSIKPHGTQVTVVLHTINEPAIN